MTLDGCKLKFVAQFKYLGHLISNSFSDDLDINRKIKALFTRMKIKLFRFYWICLYNAVLWSNFSVGAMNSLASSYVRCMKSFFGYAKYSSVTCMLLELGLPSFNTLMHNYRIGLFFILSSL